MHFFIDAFPFLFLDACCMNFLIKLDLWQAKNQAHITTPNYKSERGVKQVLSKVEELLKLEDMRPSIRVVLEEWKKKLSGLKPHEIKSNEQSLGITWLGTDFIVDYADFFLKETRNNLILFSKSDVKDKSFKLDLHSCGENRKVTGNFIT
jgi:hypothetical protein